MSSTTNANDRSSRTRWTGIALVLVGLLAVSAVAAGGALAATGQGPTLANVDEVDSYAASINTTERTVTETEVTPGGTTTVEVFVDTEGDLGDTELVEITDQFSQAFANVEHNASHPEASAAPGPDNEEFLAFWNVNTANYTVSYDVTLPTDATVGDTFEITGSVDVGGTTQSLSSETITVSGEIPDETGVKLEPASTTATVGGDTTFDVVVTGAGAGVGSYSVNVSSSNAAVGEITGIQHTNSPSTDSSQVASDGSWGLVAADLGSNTLAEGAAVTVAQVTVAAGQTGTSDLSIESGASVSNSTGVSYSLSSTNGASLTVEEEVQNPTVVDNPATDTTNDGRLNDVNGDTNFNILDVVALYGNMESSAIQDNQQLFNFNGEGGVNILDVVALYGQLS